MSSLAAENRLQQTHSPYLRQHADNPVHWQPWDEQALRLADENDVPIFLSIGYAACHWCHVMEAESFQSETIAERLNQHFVPIKVDREERPDIDQIYQTVCQLVTGSGGWPLSVWLTPDGRPFYIGTYFPPTPQRGRPGFGEVLEQITQSWQRDRDAIETRADQWQAAAKRELEQTKPGQDHAQPVLRDTARAAVQMADRDHGGFGENGPKFPQPRRIELLLHSANTFGDEQFDSVAFEALDAMTMRGLYDHIGGGFHRYATDQAWRVPHFEKMLYDNAEIPRVLLQAHQYRPTERYASVVKETIDFLETELQHSDGGLYSTLDAQSEGKEGTFYVWTPAEIEAALDDSTAAAVFCDRFGVTDRGNFDGGTTVLNISEDIETIGKNHGLSNTEVHEILETAKNDLHAYREQRERPRRDEKILAGWNGLAISMLAEAGIVLDETYAETAQSVLQFIQKHHWNQDLNRLQRRWMDGSIGVSGYLDDYAYLARGALDLHQASGELDPLTLSIKLARAIIDQFWDESAETLYYTPTGAETLMARPQDRPDQSVPSSLGVALDVLIDLAAFVPDESFQDIVRRVLNSQRARVSAAPLQHPSLVMVEDKFEAGMTELTIVADDIPSQWRSFVASHYFPHRLLTRRPTSEERITTWTDGLGLETIPPIWANREQSEALPTMYLCRDFTCSPPVTKPQHAQEWFHRLGPSSKPTEK